MKAIYWSFFSLFFFMETGFTQIVPPSSEGNSVVYFLRGANNEKFDPRLLGISNNTNYPFISYAGAFTNTKGFCLYNNNKFIGRLDTISYIRYECEAGFHLFWSRGKSNDYVEAELTAGKVYFINVSAKFGENSPDLRPVYPDNKFWVDGILHFISSQPAEVFTDDEIQRLQKRQHKKIEKALNLYEEDKRRGRNIGKLTKDIYYKSP